jgi:hypothetical protein
MEQFRSLAGRHERYVFLTFMWTEKLDGFGFLRLRVNVQHGNNYSGYNNSQRIHTIQSYAMQPILAFSSIHFPFVLLFGPLWNGFRLSCSIPSYFLTSSFASTSF